MPVAAADPSRPPARITADPSPASGAGTDPDDDPATDRLRLLLQAAEPWSDRVRGRLSTFAAELATRRRLGRALVVMVVAIGLGVAAFAAVTAASTTSPDPVQVLPHVDARAGAAPGSSTSVDDDVGGDPAGGRSASSTSVPDGVGPPGSTAPGIFVHAAGAVAAPGIHRVAADARVADVIVAAGGLAADADPDRINLAAPVRDGERVYVPRRGEPAVPDVVAGQLDDPVDGDGGGAPSTTAAPVDLNRADADELDALPGVGPATAAAIIAHRTEHGPFASVDELQDVAGIGPAKLAKLRDLVRV